MPEITPPAGQLRLSAKRPQVTDLSTLTAARSGVARSGVTRSGYTATTVTDPPTFLDIFVDDEDRSQAFDIADARITLGLNAEASSLSAQLVSRGVFSLETGQEIRVYQGGDETGIPLFSGHILQATRGVDRVSRTLDYAVEATDYRWLLNRFSLVSKFYWQQGVNTIVADLIATYADPASGFTTGYLPSALGTVGFIEFDNMRLTDCLDRLAKSVDGEAFWEVDFRKRVSMYLEPADEGNTCDVTDTGTWRHFRKMDDVAPVVTRVIFIGGGSRSTAVAAAGASTISVEETGWYNPAGGSVRCPCNTVTYTGVSIGSGAGDLTGVSGLTHDVPSGTDIWNLYQADDVAAQTTLAAALGAGQSGIATHQDSDHRFGYDRTQQAAEALLDTLKLQTTEVSYIEEPSESAPMLTHLRPGRVLTVSLTKPEALSQSLRIRSVSLTPFGRLSDGTLTFSRHVVATTNKRTLTQALAETLG